MARPPIRLPSHIRAVVRLAKARVQFVLIGVSAINFYARDAASMFSTQDCDILLHPDFRNLRRAVDAVLRENYHLSAGGEPLPTADDLLLKRILEHSAVIRAHKTGSLDIDLVLSAPSLSYPELRRGSRAFRVQGVRIHVGSLARLLKAKENAGRQKDIEFLRLYRAHRRDDWRERQQRPESD